MDRFRAHEVQDASAAIVMHDEDMDRFRAHEDGGSPSPPRVLFAGFKTGSSALTLRRFDTTIPLLFDTIRCKLDLPALRISTPVIRLFAGGMMTVSCKSTGLQTTTSLHVVREKKWRLRPFLLAHHIDEDEQICYLKRRKAVVCVRVKPRSKIRLVYTFFTRTLLGGAITS